MNKKMEERFTRSSTDSLTRFPYSDDPPKPADALAASFSG